MSESIDALVLAGGRIGGPFARAAGTSIKALAPVGGSPVICVVLGALHGSAAINRICVVAPPEAQQIEAGGVLWQDEAGGAIANLRAGLDTLGPRRADRVLLCAADLPAITAPSVDDFIDRAPAHADVCIPVVQREAFRRRFPGSLGIYVRLAEGAFTAGSQFLVRPAAVLDHMDLLEELFRRRKSQIGMARTLGAGMLWKLLARRLTIPEIEARGRELTGCDCRAVRDCHPELAYDVDGLLDWRHAAKWASGTPRSAP
jgi:molybdopterin-guanine dinucleotide biosynthesis protein A